MALRSRSIINFISEVQNVVWIFICFHFGAQSEWWSRVNPVRVSCQTKVWMGQKVSGSFPSHCWGSPGSTWCSPTDHQGSLSPENALYLSACPGQCWGFLLMLLGFCQSLNLSKDSCILWVYKCHLAIVNQYFRGRVPECHLSRLQNSTTLVLSIKQNLTKCLCDHLSTFAHMS